MLKGRQHIEQKQQLGLQQRLSPQQLQYIKLLQLPAQALEQRIQEEMELNPILEYADPFESTAHSGEEEAGDTPEHETELESLDEDREVDWDEYEENTEFDGEDRSDFYYGQGEEEYTDLPDPYHESLLENLEQQTALLSLTDAEKLIARQILGSLDEDGYFRRELTAVADNIAFNHNVYVDEDDVDRVRKQIQQLEPVGIASVNLQDCLLAQLEHISPEQEGRNDAIRVLEKAWKEFEKKHFDKIMQKLGLSEDQLKTAFEMITRLDPRPGSVASEMEATANIIEPDFEVFWQDADEHNTRKGEFIIYLNQQNSPSLRISPDYKEMWEDIKAKKTRPDARTRAFIKGKIDSANWFIESIRQRRRTLMNVMKTIVALQEDFFRFGEDLKPMILKDIAERIGMDISTVSRVVNGKYVQTRFGVFELKYFFSEGVATESGETVSNTEVKNALQLIISEEDKSKPLSDQELAEALNEKGYKVARRTVSKYREQLNEPVARLRKQIV